MSDLRYRTQVFFTCKEDREKLQRVLTKMQEQGVIGEYSFAANDISPKGPRGAARLSQPPDRRRVIYLGGGSAGTRRYNRLREVARIALKAAHFVKEYENYHLAKAWYDSVDSKAGHSPFTLYIRADQWMALSTILRFYGGREGQNVYHYCNARGEWQ